MIGDIKNLRFANDEEKVKFKRAAFAAVETGLVPRSRDKEWLTTFQEYFSDILTPEEADVCMWLANNKDLIKPGTDTEDAINILLAHERRRKEPDELINLDYKNKQKEWVQSGVSEVIEWQKQPLILQKTKDTTFDSIGSALPIIHTMWKAERYFEEAWSEHFTGGLQLFVVSHDWAAAVGGLPGDAYKNTTLPYPHCIFEFLVSGKHICQSVIEKPNGDTSVAAAIKLKSVGWFPIFPPRQFPEISTKIANFLGEQLTAILVTLDAEVTETELVRVPEKLNRAREKRGKHRLSDHHIVKLAPRTQAMPAPGPANTEKRTSPRLHFRRGHWVRYENHKTWRRWALVGDPDLGFVDKHYRL